MSLLVENVRQLQNERNSIINDATEYSASSTGWATLHDYGNIVLAVAGFVFFRFNVRVGGTGQQCFYRLKIGGVKVFATQTASGVATNVPVGDSVLVYLPAGTYDVLLEAVLATTPGYYGYANTFTMGFSRFSDCDNSIQPQGYSSQLSVTVANRATCVGALKQALVKVNVVAYTSGLVTNMENVGDSLTNGVSILINGTQRNWELRYQGSLNGVYDGCDAFGVTSAVATVGTALTITLSKRNSSTACVISVAACPWLLPSSSSTTYEPVSLSFSQQSTVYINLAPFILDETKTLKLGRVRSRSFGDATDYFSTTSGIGLVSWSYTFTLVQVDDCSMFVYGTTSGCECVETIGVDAR